MFIVSANCRYIPFFPLNFVLGSGPSSQVNWSLLNFVRHLFYKLFPDDLDGFGVDHMSCVTLVCLISLGWLVTWSLEDLVTQKVWSSGEYHSELEHWVISWVMVNSNFMMMTLGIGHLMSTWPLQLWQLGFQQTAITHDWLSIFPLYYFKHWW